MIAPLQSREPLHRLVHAVAFLVPGPAGKVKVKRVNITLPEPLLEEIDAASDNRSAFLAKAARRALEDEAV